MPAEYAAVFAARVVLRGTCFDLHCGTGRSQGPARLGLVIPKRLARRAVLRNGIKRQVREVFRCQGDRLPQRDYVFRLARWPEAMKSMRPADEAMRKAIRAEVERLIERSVTDRKAAGGLA